LRLNTLRLRMSIFRSSKPSLLDAIHSCLVYKLQSDRIMVSLLSAAGGLEARNLYLPAVCLDQELGDMELGRKARKCEFELWTYRTIISRICLGFQSPGISVRFPQASTSAAFQQNSGVNYHSFSHFDAAKPLCYCSTVWASII
jgi:hypothetical protein